MLLLSLPQILSLFASSFFFYWLPRSKKVLALLVLSWAWFLYLDARHLPLLLFTILFDYSVAKYLEDPRLQKFRTAMLLASVSLNILILLFFKFVFYSSRLAQQTTGNDGATLTKLSSWGIPLGVSFFTFHSVSYVFDVYRRKIPACHSFPQYALFVSFFPKIAAGPIERFSAFSRQLRQGLCVNASSAIRAIKLLLAGYFLKLVVGDNLSLLVKMNFDSPSAHDFFSSLLGTYAFSAEIYADFLGYTLIARGAALLFGIELSRNFSAPYLAISPTEFWRRWHISLSHWFRDYVYIPLGGNRYKRIRNIILTMALAGLWHGLDFPFLLWGLYHGILLCITKPLERFFRARMPRWVSIFVTFHLVAFGWIFFRSANLQQSLDIIGGFSRWHGDFTQAQLGQISLFLWLVLPWILYSSFLSFFRRLREQSWFLLFECSVSGLCLVFILIFGSLGAVPFLYFRF